MNEKKISKYRYNGYSGIKRYTEMYLKSWLLYYGLDEKLLNDDLTEELAYRYKKWMDNVAIHQLGK